MGRYIVRRLLLVLLTLFLVFFLIHYLTSISLQMSGDPARAFFPAERAPSEAQLEAVRIDNGLDDPCLRQIGNPCLTMFVDRLQEYASGDFGKNYNKQPVADQIARAIPNTLRLFTFTFGSWMIVGLGLGMLAAWRRGKVSDYTIRFSTILAGAIPAFLLVLAYKYIFAAPLRKFFTEEYGKDSLLALLFKPSFDPNFPWISVIVPGILIGVTGIDSFVRLTRATVLENMGSDFVRTARAKGLRGGRIMGVHVLRNAMIPISTMIGFQLAAALAGAVFTEGIMNIRGMGQLAYQAALKKEIPVLLAVVTIGAVGMLVVNLIVDLMYAVFDPRIRYE